jgi:hypothetical protein
MGPSESLPGTGRNVRNASNSTYASVIFYHQVWQFASIFIAFGAPATGGVTHFMKTSFAWDGNRMIKL